MRDLAPPVLPSTALALLVACGGPLPENDAPIDVVPGTPETLTEERRFTVCSPAGEVEESYDFALVEQELAEDVELAEATGLERIASCDDARRFARARFLRDAGALHHLDVADVDLASPEIGSQRQAIWKGDRSGDQRVLQIAIPRQLGSPNDAWLGDANNAGADFSWCSAIAFSERHLLTAAHCIPSGVSGFWRAYVWRAEASGANKGEPRALGDFRIFVYRHPSYSGTGDAANDVALISLHRACVGNSERDAITVCSGAPYQRVASNTNLMRVWLGNLDVGTRMAIKGWGTRSRYGWTDPRLNYGDGGAQISIDWRGPRHFLADDETQAIVCNGDSGGPAMLTADWASYAAGLLSNSMKKSGQRCARNSGARALRKQRWHRLNATFESWVEPKLHENPWFDCPGTASQCCLRGDSANAYTHWQHHDYARCW